VPGKLHSCEEVGFRGRNSFREEREKPVVMGPLAPLVVRPLAAPVIRRGAQRLKVSSTHDRWETLGMVMLLTP